MSNSQAHITTMSQTSSTECGRRNQRTTSAAKLRNNNVDRMPIRIGVKLPPLALSSVGKMPCLAVTIQVAIDIAAATAMLLPRIARPADPFILTPPSLSLSNA